MRKTLLLTMFLIVVLFSGCASNESIEPDHKEMSFESSLSFDLESLTYANTAEADLLFELGSASTDYIIMTNKIEELSSNDETAHVSILTVFDQVSSADNTFSIKDLTTYSSKDIEEYASQAELTITITDIITFNTIKSEIESYRNNYIPNISKQEYVELLLERDLTDNELQGFIVLQEYYFDLIYHNGADYSFVSNTFNELLILFDEYMEYVPTEEIELNLEAAYNILNSLLIE